ncbi:hypothetical protein HYX00_05660 [Candidatus Woesearchaeota archaeon]|nr:hypothetical protein [Candidatus Woesearchaeota archaeon]
MTKNYFINTLLAFVHGLGLAIIIMGFLYLFVADEVMEGIGYWLLMVPGFIIGFLFYLIPKEKIWKYTLFLVLIPVGLLIILVPGYGIYFAGFWLAVGFPMAILGWLFTKIQSKTKSNVLKAVLLVIGCLLFIASVHDYTLKEKIPNGYSLVRKLKQEKLPLGEIINQVSVQQLRCKEYFHFYLQNKCFYLLEDAIIRIKKGEL